MEKIFREGYRYKRAGVLLGGLVNQNAGRQQTFLLSTVDHTKHEQLISALDTLNTRFARNMVRNAAQTIGSSHPAHITKPAVSLLYDEMEGRAKCQLWFQV